MRSRTNETRESKIREWNSSSQFQPGHSSSRQKSTIQGKVPLSDANLGFGQSITIWRSDNILCISETQGLGSCAATFTTTFFSLLIAPPFTWILAGRDVNQWVRDDIWWRKDWILLDFGSDSPLEHYYIRYVVYLVYKGIAAASSNRDIPHTVLICRSPPIPLCQLAKPLSLRKADCFLHRSYIISRCTAWNVKTTCLRLPCYSWHCCRYWYRSLCAHAYFVGASVGIYGNDTQFVQFSTNMSILDVLFSFDTERQRLSAKFVNLHFIIFITNKS